MSEPFDPYRKWLGIPPKDQPPNHYRLLGIAHFEDDPDVIENAATRQMAHVRTYQSGKFSALSQKILNELTGAKLCLLQRERKAPYDEQLRAKLSAEGKLSSDNLLAPPQVMEESAQPYKEPREELPDLQRMSSQRWKIDSDEPPAAEPPIVPIPMPVGTAVAAAPRLSPAIPMSAAPLLVSAPLRSSYRPRKSSSAAVPLAIAIIGLLLLFGGGIVAVLLSGILSKQSDKHPKKAATTSTGHPAGVAAKERDKEKKDVSPRPDSSSSANPESTFPSGSSEKKVEPEPPRKKAVSLGSVEDEMRQAVFFARQALEKRDADICKGHVVTAESLLSAHPEVDSKVKEQVQLIRELFNRNGEFWSLVRDAAINGKVPSGKMFYYRKEEFELISHEGDVVTYTLAGNERSAPLMEIQAKAALALASQSTQQDHGKRLAMLAFGMIDKRASDEHFNRDWAKKFYTALALEGHTSANMARELGVEEKPDPAKTKVPEGDDEPAKEGTKEKPDKSDAK